MASSSEGLRIGIQVVLGIIIVALAYWLYVSITEPYQVILREERATDMTRQRMDHIRQAMIRFEADSSRFPMTLDSLVMYVKQDSAVRADAEDLFGTSFDSFNPDSLPFSPRTGERFELTVNDTSQVKTYLLEDPNSEDYIGTTAGDVTQLNAASWE